MPALPISNVRQNLFGLVKQVNDNHDPLTVVTKTGENAVLVAESDWNSLMETLYVLQTHGGAQLLRSAQDARDGRTQAHELIDPDAETPEDAQAELIDLSAETPADVVAMAIGDAVTTFVNTLTYATVDAMGPTNDILGERLRAALQVAFSSEAIQMLFDGEEPPMPELPVTDVWRRA